ncbi:hypothetical protein QBC34DRAFT_12319 [Podospora aff. communis PSN243]|uniref:Uncharacterized protein n=1 Tax=Podospora aff. communis PSN243 TaxID=3040156 RepID=A0AAV9H6Y6_9PEZI|nr:hypothetical protein QBC34DRAFT_12319 [Podospora aff. communis PSN243]
MSPDEIVSRQCPLPIKEGANASAPPFILLHCFCLCCFGRATGLFAPSKCGAPLWLPPLEIFGMDNLSSRHQVGRPRRLMSSGSRWPIGSLISCRHSVFNLSCGRLVETLVAPALEDIEQSILPPIKRETHANRRRARSVAHDGLISAPPASRRPSTPLPHLIVTPIPHWQPQNPMWSRMRSCCLPLQAIQWLNMRLERVGAAGCVLQRRIAMLVGPLACVPSVGVRPGGAHGAFPTRR